MYFLDNLNALRLDLVGIVAILGEASIAKTSQISSCSWWHAFPRLMPAPQALVQHQRAGRLPTQNGLLIGVYAGTIKTELNFFCQLMHSKPLERYEVEFLTVRRKPRTEDCDPYELKPWAGLWFLSVIGFGIVVVLVALSIHYEDGWALVGVLLLSATSSLLGLASKWHLTFQAQRPAAQQIPDSDLVIYYPSAAAFRVVRCDELTHRMYITAEAVEYQLSDGYFRLAAVSGTITLIVGLICIANAGQILQLALAMTYVLLNIIYWLASAQSFKTHWRVNYKSTAQTFAIPTPNTDPTAAEPEPLVGLAGLDKTTNEQIKEDIEMQRGVQWQDRENTGETTEKGVTPKQSPGQFTRALWKVIALTGTSDWLLKTNIAPTNAAWESWIRLAGIAAGENASGHNSAYFEDNILYLPDWPYQQEINRLLQDMPQSQRKRPRWSSRQLHSMRPDIVHTNSWWTPSPRNTQS